MGKPDVGRTERTNSIEVSTEKLSDEHKEYVFLMVSPSSINNHFCQSLHTNFRYLLIFNPLLLVIVNRSTAFTWVGREAEDSYFHALMYCTWCGEVTWQRRNWIKSSKNYWFLSLNLRKQIHYFILIEYFRNKRDSWFTQHYEFIDWNILGNCFFVHIQTKGFVMMN